MSPLLFAIFVSDLGKELNATGLGVKLGSLNISALFFADDIGSFNFVLVGFLISMCKYELKISSTLQS